MTAGDINLWLMEGARVREERDSGLVVVTGDDR